MARGKDGSIDTVQTGWSFEPGERGFSQALMSAKLAANFIEIVSGKIERRHSDLSHRRLQHGCSLQLQFNAAQPFREQVV